MKYCVCVSNYFGELALKHLYQNHTDIGCVLTDKKSVDIISFCEEKNIPYYAGNPREGRSAQWMMDNAIDATHLLSINYLFILEGDVIRRFKLAVNIHSSLLPKYRGRTPHVWAIINGEKEYGVTAHLMNESCDDGDIIIQIHIPIGEEDTGADLLKREEIIDMELLDDVIKAIENDDIHPIKQDLSKATYFGKRTPADGGINWDWQKERIRNWVRAQAEPYPGAFSYINGNKVIINKIEYSDFGFSYDIPNGKIVKIEDGYPFVKTPNGVVKLVNFHYDGVFENGDILK